MKRYVLTEPLIFAAGTELTACDDGSLAMQSDRGLVTLQLGRRAALEEGMVVARPVLRVVGADAVEDFMAPGIDWFSPADYINAFREMTGAETMQEAAYTKPGFNPGFVNVQLSKDQTEIVLTVRGEPSGGPRGDAETGAWARMSMPLEDWDQFVAHATQVRRMAAPDEAAAHDDLFGEVEAGTDADPA